MADLSWLPDLIPYPGGDQNDWLEYLERLYDQFTQDFLSGALPQFAGKPMNLKRYPYYDGKCATFWHFITEGEIEKDRAPDMRRCEHIAWPRALLDAAVKNGPVHVWANTRRNGTGWVITPVDFSYKFVVVERPDFVLPWAAYPITYSHQRDKLEHEFEDWKSRQAPRAQAPARAPAAGLPPPARGAAGRPAAATACSPSATKTAATSPQPAPAAAPVSSVTGIAKPGKS